MIFLAGKTGQKVAVIVDKGEALPHFKAEMPKLFHRYIVLSGQRTQGEKPFFQSLQTLWIKVVIGEETFQLRHGFADFHGGAIKAGQDIVQPSARFVGYAGDVFYGVADGAFGSAFTVQFIVSGLEGFKDFLAVLQQGAARRKFFRLIGFGGHLVDFGGTGAQPRFLGLGFGLIGGGGFALGSGFAPRMICGGRLAP